MQLGSHTNSHGGKGWPSRREDRLSVLNVLFEDSNDVTEALLQVTVDLSMIELNQY